MSTPRGESDEDPAAPAGAGLWGGLWLRLARARSSAAPHGEGRETETETGYSREALQAMIARKRHNDAVRHREFDTLRKLRRREWSVQPVAALHPVLFHSSIPSRPDERATTLKKIDEIEAQMSIQWRRVKARAPVRTAPSLATRSPGTATISLDATVAADTVHLSSQSIPPYPPRRALGVADRHAQEPAAGAASPLAVRQGHLQPLPQPLAGAAPDVPSFVHDPEFEEAAFRFARGDHAGAEALLRALVAPGHPRSTQPDTWQVMFDLYRATGEQGAYDERATDYACRFQRSPPQWSRLCEPDAPASARGVEAAPSSFHASVQGEAPLIDWACPPVLDGQGVRQLQAVLASRPQPWRLSWVALAHLAPEALPALSQLVAHWTRQPLRLRLAGIDRLERILDTRTACGDRSADPLWWTLRMDWLRAMRRSDEFELVALDYCVTYEVSPPAWDAPRCEVRVIQEEGGARGDTRFEALESRVSVLGSSELSAMSGFGASVFEQPPAIGELAGTLLGDISGALARLEATLQGADLLVVSCSRLERIDFEAAGALLNWVSARQAEGRVVQLVDVHRLVAIFLGAMGLSCITLRRD